MRVNRLDLTRYGRFTDACLNFPPPAPGAPDLHVIFGPNEAGKSTLFNGWLDLLYGIPARTRYDFRHTGPMMQIGAQLTHAGGALTAVRVKRNGPSLQDANGQTLPEAVMQSALSGLGRDGYTAMFSLDDDTLEQGGDAILASKGDLGEMLFAASAGLAGLGPQLDMIRKELDTFHKPRARNTTLKAAKDRLHDLDRQRRDLDTTASGAQKLHRDVVAAETAWRQARQAEGAADAALQSTTAALAVLPQRARLARLRADLEPLAHLPDATDADDRALQQLDQSLQLCAGQMATRAAALAELQRRQAALPRDPAILPLADRIAAVSGLYPLHQAALADLPRRHDALAGVQGDLTRHMATLGLTGAAPDHTLAPVLLARLRALLARRDMAVQTMARAQSEVAMAQARLPDAPDHPAPPEDAPTLSHLVARLRQTDPDLHRNRAAQDCDARNADLARALLPLAPWRGTAAELAALGVPAPWQLAAWQAADQATARALRDAKELLDRRSAALSAAQPAPTRAADTPSLAQATQARAAREAAWAAHLARLSPDTAAAFESALRLDDRIGLHLAEAMAAARYSAAADLALSRLMADVAQATADLHAAQSDRQAHDAAVAACGAALGLTGAGLTDLIHWLHLRDTALLAHGAQGMAQATLARADAALRDATDLLATALGLPCAHGFARLWAAALARLDTSSQRQAEALRRAGLHADLAGRTHDLTVAEQALRQWQQDWHAACDGTTLAAHPPLSEGLAALLEGLDTLGRVEGERAELADRIAKMQTNSAAFQTAAAAVLVALGQPDDAPWDGVPDRLARAQQAERDHATMNADLARDGAAQAADRAQAEALTTQRRALATRLACATPDAQPDPLPDHLAACLRAARLRRDCAELQAELAQHPAPDQDAASLQAAANAQQTALALARTDAETCFAALTTAQHALRAVGGDDAVARLAAERANLLDALQDQARAHLAQRFALLAFEQGLRRYRDSHRSAMLARASDAFRKLTCGKYTGLAAQTDGTAEVLVAQPAIGGAKLAIDLSKGTRFQLYLALRIAGYHELAKARPPVPFIADDIMETFDDARAAAAFGLLADMAGSGQVIYLTHHQHLCDMARKVCPQANIIDLAGIGGA